MKLIDIINQPTKAIEPVANIVLQPKPENKPKPIDPNQPPPATEEKIELAAEINAAALATLIEAPTHTFNNIVNYKLKRRKARKQLKGEELDEMLKRIDENYKENKEAIDLTEGEYGRLKDIMRARARMNGGKVNENLEMASIILGSIIKRAIVFVPLD